MLSLYEELKLINYRAVLALKWAPIGKIQKQVLVHSETYLNDKIIFQLNRKSMDNYKIVWHSF